MFQILINYENFEWVILFLALFVIYFGFWINFSYFWHYIFENGFKLGYFSNGLKIVVRGLKSPPKTTNRASFGTINLKLLNIMIIRWLFLIILLFLLILSFFTVSGLNLEIFLVIYFLIGLTHLLYELESRNVTLGYGVTHYGNSFAIYELLSFITLFIWIISNNTWNFNDFRIFPWSFEIDIRLIQTIIVLIMIFSLARSTNYLGYKKAANYQQIVPTSEFIPNRISMSHYLSQLFFQNINIFLLATLTVEQTYLFIFGSKGELWVYSFLFTALLLFFSLVILFFSTVTFKIKKKNFSIYLVILFYLISILAIILFFFSLTVL